MGGKRSAIRNHVKRVRLARTDLTQAEFARRLGVTRQTVIAIEAGRYGPSLELAFRMSVVLGEPLTDLFKYDASTLPDSDNSGLD